MKLNNLQVLNIYAILNTKYNQLDDIKLKWKLANLSEDLFKIKARFDNEKNQLIDKYGTENEEKIKSLDVNDKHFKDLLMCETEISSILLDDLSDFLFTMDELIVLKPIIEQ